MTQISNLKAHYKAITKKSYNGKIIESEANEVINVENSTITKLIKYNGGILSMIMLNFAMLGFMLGSIYGSILIM